MALYTILLSSALKTNIQWLKWLHDFSRSHDEIIQSNISLLKMTSMQTEVLGKYIYIFFLFLKKKYWIFPVV